MPTELHARPTPGASKRALLRTDIASHQLFLATMRLKLLAEKANFDPTQPRVPAGDPAGGQWTGGSGGGSSRLRRLAGGSEEDTRPNRTIIDEFVDSTAEVRTAVFNSTMQQLRQLEPNNPQLTYVTGSDYTPSSQAIQDVQAELNAARNRVAYRIGQGHAFDEHADELNADNSAELAATVRSVISDPSSQSGRIPGSNRTLFYRQTNNTLVIVDPASEDSGSIYKPHGGQGYVNKLLKGR